MRQGLRFFLTALAMLSCSAPKPATRPGTQTVQSANSDGVPTLLLSWQPQSGPVSSYQIFYVSGTKSQKIGSIPQSDPTFNNPQLTISNANMESWPEKGSQACFYVVADNNGLLSDPSDQICVTM